MVWKKYPFEIFELEIFVSEFGDIKCDDKDRVSNIGLNGYKLITFKSNGSQVTKYIHRMVCETFINQYDVNLNVVNHKDGNKLNNHYSNLEWVNYSINNKHAFDNGLKEATYNRRKVRLYNLITCETHDFEMIRDCARFIINNINDDVKRNLQSTEASLSRVLSGERKKYLKHTLKYID